MRQNQESVALFEQMEEEIKREVQIKGDLNISQRLQKEEEMKNSVELLKQETEDTESLAEVKYKISALTN